MEAAIAYLQRDAPELDLEPIMEGLNAWLRPELEDLAARQLGLQAGGWTSWDGQAFVTGKPNEAVVTFSLRHELVDPSEENLEVVGYATSSGDVVAGLVSGEARSTQLSSISFTVLGEGPRGGLTVVRPGSAFSGPRISRHELRVPAPLVPGRPSEFAAV